MGRIQEREADGYVVDALLLPRLRQYGYNNDVLDIEGSVQYLRRNYREYRRKQQGPFRKLVTRAVQILQGRQAAGGAWQGGGGRPKVKRSETRLRQQEDGHVSRFRRREEPGITASEDDLTSSGSDDCYERKEGEFGEETDNPRCRVVDREELDSAGGEGGPAKRRTVERVPSVRKAKKRRSTDDHSAGESEKAPSRSPAFNLLNSSLRITYDGSSSIVFEPSLHGKALEPASSLDGRPCLVVEQQETEGQVGPSFSLADGDAGKVTPPFAPHSVIAAAAKEASKKHRGPPDSGKTSQKKSLVEERDDGVGFQLEPPLSAVEDTGETAFERKEENICADKNKRFKVNKIKKRNGLTEKVDCSGNASLEARSTAILKTTAEAVRFSDLGDMDRVLEMVLEVIYPLLHPQIYPWLGLQPMGGILLHGPPGCGKTKLANAIAFETGLPFLKISAPEVVSGMSGESEAKVRALFADAARLAPCIVFIDEIDAITPKRENAQREMERRIVTQFMTCMDELGQAFNGYDDGDESVSGRGSKGHVLVIGATNRLEALDPALRRPGRFDREISLGIPDENGREKILQALTKNLRLEGSFNFKQIARCTPGYVGADLVSLTREAASVALKRVIASRDPSMKSSLKCRSDPTFWTSKECHATDTEVGVTSHLTENTNLKGTDIKNSSLKVKVADEIWWKLPWTQEEMKSLSISMQDFEKAVPKVQPSGKREGFSAIPDVRWEDVGALEEIQRKLQFFISRRIKNPKDYEVLGMDMMDTGFLLYGPPGCGKTLVAKAVANDAQANFIYIKGPELLNKYVGESEHSIRVLFSRARSCAPCILFFDEIDALAPRRGTDGNAVAERVLNQLLAEMDGAERRKGVFLIAATNRPDMIDPAILRPGRLGKLLYIPLPDMQGRISILRALTRQKPVSADVDLAWIAENKACDGLSGADLAALVNEACVAAIQEKIANQNNAAVEDRGKAKTLLVFSRHFDTALLQIAPSVSKQDLKYYAELPKKFNRTGGMKGILCESFL